MLKTSTQGLLLLALATAHLAFSLWVNPPGYLTFDSGTYHYMVKTLSTTGSFSVWNGFEEFPSPALEVAQLSVHDGRLVSQYPELLSFLGYPLYMAFGYHGLLLLNALAFIGINAVIFSLASLLFESTHLSYLAMMIYSFGTFAWEYSQSSYPHLSSTLLILTSYYLVVRCYVRTCDRRASPSESAMVLSAGAGLVAGLAVGLRLDSAFAIPGLFVPLLFAGRVLATELMALLAGLGPGFLFLSITNYLKFNTLSPLSYGTSDSGYTGNLGWYLPIFFLAAFLGAFLLLLKRLPAARRPYAWVALAGCLALAAMSRPTSAWSYVSQLADGAYQIVVDLRIRDLDIREPALTRTAGGAMIYMGGVKKALLQSCPYLVILPFLLVDALRQRKNVRKYAFLCLVPASFITYYSYLAWHGSIALNMRYLNPTLPFLAILSACAWRGISDNVSCRAPALFGGALMAGLFVLFASSDPPLPQQENLFLTTPLLIAAAIVVGETARRSGWVPSLSRPLVSYLLLTAFAWSGAVAFGRDYPTSTVLRRANLLLADNIRPYIRDDSLIVSDMTDCCWKLIDEVANLRIADPSEDDYRTFESLVRFHLARGRSVYLAYSPLKLAELMSGGWIAAFELRLLNRWSVPGRPELMLFEIRLRRTPAATPAATPPRARDDRDG